jgi:hypothetical protein
MSQDESDYNSADPYGQSLTQPSGSLADRYPSIVQAYQQFLGRPPSEAEIASQTGNGSFDPGDIRVQYSINNIMASPEAQQRRAGPPKPADTNTPPPPAATPPPASGPGNQTPPDIYNAPLTKPYGGTFTPPAPVNLGGPAGIPYIPPTPSFGVAQAPPTFTAPSVADALNDPGYQFRVQEGDKGLQNWAGARGTLNDSSVAKALEDYNQNAASQEYANVFDRSLQGFGTRYGTWRDAVLGPTMTAYSTQATAGANQNQFNYLNAWDQFLNDQSQYNTWQDRTFNKLYQTATY